MTDFSIRTEANGPHRDLILSGDVDLQVAERLTRVAHSQLADSDVQCLRLDLGAVTFMDSTGMGALVRIRNTARQQGQTIELVNIPERIRQLLLLTGLGGVFEIDSSDTSRAKPSGPKSVADGSERDAPTDRQLRIVPS